MARQKKFKRGRVVSSTTKLVRLVEAGNWIYWNHKPQHPKVIASMTLRTLQGAVLAGILRLAEPTK
jgi:hypothetical protein